VILCCWGRICSHLRIQCQSDTLLLGSDLFGEMGVEMAVVLSTFIISKFSLKEEKEAT
jgi:hypothetical protein